MSTSALSEKRTIPVVMTIAGSDSGGGAGIQVDLRTFHALQTFGTSAITALTSQNPAEVRRVDPVPAEGVRTQICTVMDQLAVRAVKTGMLFSREIVRTAASVLKERFQGPVVVDPVMISTSGVKLLQDDAIDAVRDDLLPVSDWVTPNRPEACLLAGETLDTPEKLADAARMIVRKWKINVVLKGGHASPSEPASDFVCLTSGELFALVSPRLPVKPLSDHGTGCTFSAALAAFLARGKEPLDALCMAKAFVFASLRDAVSIGLGEEPLFGMYPPDSLESSLKQISVEKL